MWAKLGPNTETPQCVLKGVGPYQGLPISSGVPTLPTLTWFLPIFFSATHVVANIAISHLWSFILLVTYILCYFEKALKPSLGLNA